jgi:hypothetical protein
MAVIAAAELDQIFAARDLRCRGLLGLRRASPEKQRQGGESRRYGPCALVFFCVSHDHAVPLDGKVERREGSARSRKSQESDSGRLRHRFNMRELDCGCNFAARTASMSAGCVSSNPAMR